MGFQERAISGFQVDLEPHSRWQYSRLAGEGGREFDHLVSIFLDLGGVIHQLELFMDDNQVVSQCIGLFLERHLVELYFLACVGMFLRCLFSSSDTALRLALDRKSLLLVRIFVGLAA